MIDEKGYRQNVGIIILNSENKVFWGRRIGQKSWQFPQGGIDENETLEDAMFRELREETGLLPEHVEIIASTQNWLAYDLPKRYRRKNTTPLCIGQKQKWFLLRLVVSDTHIDLNSSEKAEFDDFQWVSYWSPIKKVIYFKRHVYRVALEELAKTANIAPNAMMRRAMFQRKKHKRRPPHHRNKPKSN